MASSRIHFFLKNRKKELLLGGAVILLVIISLLVNFSGISKKTGRIVSGGKNPRIELLKKQEQFVMALDEERKINAPLLNQQSRRQDFWLPERDGNPQYGFRKRIEASARSSELKLKSFGAIQNQKITEGLIAYQVNITADAQLEAILRFMDGISKEAPRVSWKNLTVTPDNTRAPNYLIMNGTLQIVVLNAPGIAEKLWGRTNADNLPAH